MNTTPTATRVAVVGASGYTGAELLRLILTHPRMELVAVAGHSTAGRALGEVFPSFAHLNLTLRAFDPDEISELAEVVFLALPHGTSQEAAHALRSRGARVIDLSADHRFDDPELYARVYGAPHLYPDRLREAIYGLPELRRDELRDAALIACPGCYPTSVALAVAPALSAGLLTSHEIIADCKSGLSGAGRGAKVGSLMSERGESMQGYKTLDHRHAPEMEATLTRELEDHTGDPVKVWFSPHLVPMTRGILSTVYLRLKAGVDIDAARKVYERAYQSEPFVTLLPSGQSPTTLSVRGTNRCQIGLTVRANLLVVHAAIDNLGKGAAGQAIQCFNISSGFSETLGLGHTALYP